MKQTALTIIAAIAMMLAATAVSRAEEYKTATVKGTECYIYYVKQGEGFYSLNRKFGVTRDDVVKLNPSARNGLNRGQKLYIPIPEKAEVNTSPDVATHIVKQGESLYAISRQYDTTVAEIMELNGLTSSALKAGVEIKIPQKAAGTAVAGAQEKKNAKASAV